MMLEVGSLIVITIWDLIFGIPSPHPVSQIQFQCRDVHHWVEEGGPSAALSDMASHIWLARQNVILHLQRHRT